MLLLFGVERRVRKQSQTEPENGVRLSLENSTTWWQRESDWRTDRMQSKNIAYGQSDTMLNCRHSGVHARSGCRLGETAREPFPRGIR